MNYQTIVAGGIVAVTGLIITLYGIFGGQPKNPITEKPIIGFERQVPEDFPKTPKIWLQVSPDNTIHVTLNSGRILIFKDVLEFDAFLEKVAKEKEG